MDNLLNSHHWSRIQNLGLCEVPDWFHRLSCFVFIYQYLFFVMAFIFFFFLTHFKYRGNKVKHSSWYLFTVKTAAAKSALAISHERSAKKLEMSRSQRSKVALHSIRDWGLFSFNNIPHVCARIKSSGRE